MDTGELLPGAREYLVSLRKRGIKTALASASKNAPLILQRVNITDLFDAVVDGNRAHKAKPDPQAFLLAASDLRLFPADCVVFEDAEAGVQAARNAGMHVVGIGQPSVLGAADKVVANLGELIDK
jgi:beta-phosphoglucomutase